MTSRPLGARPRAPESEAAAAKASLRVVLQERRSVRSESPEASQRRRAAAFELSQYHETVACYGSQPGEPDTWGLIEDLFEAGITVLMPVLGWHSDGTVRHDPDWARYAGRAALRPGYRGILEPTTPALGSPAIVRATLVWCAGLAGTVRGERLGTGGGWYDRALGWTCDDSMLGLLLYDDEVLERVPTEAWDRRMDVIVTENRVLDCHPDATE